MGWAGNEGLLLLRRAWMLAAASPFLVTHHAIIASTTTAWVFTQCAAFVRAHSPQEDKVRRRPRNRVAR
jgi:hypothetical protein